MTTNMRFMDRDRRLGAAPALGPGPLTPAWSWIRPAWTNRDVAETFQARDWCCSVTTGGFRGLGRANAPIASLQHFPGRTMARLRHLTLPRMRSDQTAPNLMSISAGGLRPGEDLNRRAFLEPRPSLFRSSLLRGDENMPATFIMWAVPTIIVLGGISYYFLRVVQ